MTRLITRKPRPKSSALTAITSVLGNALEERLKRKKDKEARSKYKPGGPGKTPAITFKRGRG